MARKVNDKEKLRRRSIMLPASFVDSMGEVRKQIGAKSDSEVIRRAFALYKKIVNPNVDVLLVDPKTGKQIKLIIT